MREEGQFGKVLKSQTSLSDREAVFELVSIIFWKYLVWLEELLAEDESLLGNLFYKKQKLAKLACVFYRQDTNICTENGIFHHRAWKLLRLTSAPHSTGLYKLYTNSYKT